jgi:hypothetical protein
VGIWSYIAYKQWTRIDLFKLIIREKCYSDVMMVVVAAVAVGGGEFVRF